MREWQCTQQNTLLVCIFLFIFLWKVEGRNKRFIPNKSIMLRRKKTKIWTSFIVYCLVQFDLYFWKLEDMLPIRGWVVLHVYYSLGNKTIIGDKARILQGYTISVILLLLGHPILHWNADMHTWGLSRWLSGKKSNCQCKKWGTGHDLVTKEHRQETGS